MHPIQRPFTVMLKRLSSAGKLPLVRFWLALQQETTSLVRDAPCSKLARRLPVILFARRGYIRRACEFECVLAKCRIISLLFCVAAPKAQKSCI